MTAAPDPNGGPVKGIVFTELLELIESAFGYDVADTVIENSDSSTGGSYTAVGSYDHRELLSIVGALSAATDTPAPDLVRTFGGHLFGRFAILYPQLFEGVDSAFDFLAQVEDVIHVEVRKLYPDAELPRFEHSHPSDRSLELVYRSERPFADLAEGLIHACCAHFGEDCSIERTDEDACTRFAITRVREKA